MSVLGGETLSKFIFYSFQNLSLKNFKISFHLSKVKSIAKQNII